MTQSPSSTGSTASITATGTRFAGLSTVTVFGALALASVAFTYSGVATQVLWWSSFIFIGCYHIVRQHFGLLRLYQLRAGDLTSDEFKAESLLLQAGCAFPLLLNIHHGWLYEELGAFVFALRVPAFVPYLVGALALWGLLRVLVQLFGRFKRGQTIAWQRFALILLAVSSYNLALLFLAPTKLLIATLLVTTYHDLQYLPLVWILGKRRYGDDEGAKQNPLFAWAFGPGKLLRYAILLLIGGVIHSFFSGMFADIPALNFTRSVFSDQPSIWMYLLNFIIGTELAHFLLDGRMWRFGEDERLLREFELIDETR